MTYSEFADKMLIALYQESESDTPKPEGITFGFLTERYGLPRNDRWLERLAKEWENEGLADVSDLLAPAADLEVEIGGRGMRRIEQMYGSKDGIGVILQPVEQERAELVDALSEITGSRMFISKGGRLPDNPREGDIVFQIADGPAVDSGAWTGLPKTGVLAPGAADRLKAVLQSVEGAVEQGSLSNAEKAQARAYAVAIHALAEAPEPPADLIWKLVSRAADLATIGAFFTSLLALFANA